MITKRHMNYCQQFYFGGTRSKNCRQMVAMGQSGFMVMLLVSSRIRDSCQFENRELSSLASTADCRADFELVRLVSMIELRR